MRLLYHARQQASTGLLASRVAVLHGVVIMQQGRVRERGFRVYGKRSDKSVNFPLETESPSGTRPVGLRPFDAQGTNLSTPVTTSHFCCVVRVPTGVATVLYCMQLTDTTKTETPRRTRSGVVVPIQYVHATALVVCVVLYCNPLKDAMQYNTIQRLQCNDTTQTTLHKYTCVW